MVKVVTYILDNNVTVQGLVGTKTNPTTDSNYKVFPVVAPSNETAPYIAVRLAGRVPLGKDCDYQYGVQVVSYANSYDDVTALNEAVIDAIKGQASATVNGQSFGYLNVTNEQDDYVKEHNLFAKILTLEGAAE